MAAKKPVPKNRPKWLPDMDSNHLRMVGKLLLRNSANGWASAVV